MAAIRSARVVSTILIDNSSSMTGARSEPKSVVGSKAVWFPGALIAEAQSGNDSPLDLLDKLPQTSDILRVVQHL